MDSSFNLLEFRETINGQSDDFNTKQHSLCFRTVDEAEPSFVSANGVSKHFPIGHIDCEFAGELWTENVESTELIDDLKSTAALRYIRQLLLEEESDDKISTCEEALALLATEKAFNDILRQEYYIAPDEPQVHDPANQIISVDESNCKQYDGAKRESSEKDSGDDVHPIKPPSASDDPTLVLPLDSLTAEQIQNGIDEAMKFLPNIGEFFINRETNRSIGSRDCLLGTKKNHSYSDMYQLEGRAHKQIVAYSDEPIRNENFDKILLLDGKKYIEEDTMLRKTIKKEMKDQFWRSKRNYAMVQDNNQTMEESIDLRSLLINCSLAVSANDHSMAKELIYKLRKCSSPSGDWSQRLAYYFVDGLEARLSGTANEIYHRILPEKLTVLEELKAYRLYLAVSPCRRALVYFFNQTILNNISKHTQKVHIINYGIKQGFHWPAFFEYISNSEGIPPKIRFTLIEVPEPGFRPRRKVDLIGLRLADYAKSFSIPFEFEGIVSKWENVKVEDMKIAHDEVVIVSCIVHSEKLSDEVFGTDSPRDIFLNTIRKINPRVFIHVNVNGSYNSPFFPVRFRHALSYYSSLFEMLDSNLPRDNPERLSLERNILMPAAMNSIAFEGPDRVERPETYRQWHGRKLRAGLVPLPVNAMIKNNIKEFVREHYHKDFVIDDDNGWLLMGWKGRIWYGLTTWKAKEV